MVSRLASVLAANPEFAFELYCQASEVVDDFNEFGPVLQADADGQYSSETTIRRLEAVRNRIVSKIAD
jgi:hypothetical protein